MSRQRPLRVGMICTGNPHDPTHLSGMPYHLMCALIDAGIDLVPLCPEEPAPSSGLAWRSIKRLARPLRESQLGRALRSRVRLRRQRLHREAESTSSYAELIDRARAQSTRVSRQIAAHDFDLLFGICMSTALYELETDLPIIYASDATAQLILDTYPDYETHSAGYRKACMELEGNAMARIDVGIFPSRRTLDSAIEHHGLPRAKSRLIPFGSNVTARKDQRLELDPPSREALEIVIVAADPVRKRLDLCVEVTELLRSRGIQATLNSIGPPTPRAAASPFVNSLGPLRLSEAADRELHQDILQRSHLMLLPSMGEMFGIAPGEAAHFGRPSLVSDVGGLPTVVEHGRTGLVLPEDATAAEYAEAIAALVDDADAYRSLSVAALERAQSVLNWGAFAREAGAIFEEVLRER